MARCDWNEEFDFTGICGGAGEGLEALELGVTMSWPVRVLVRVQLVSAATTKAAASSMLERRQRCRLASSSRISTAVENHIDISSPYGKERDNSCRDRVL